MMAADTGDGAGGGSGEYGMAFNYDFGGDGFNFGTPAGGGAIPIDIGQPPGSGVNIDIQLPSGGFGGGGGTPSVNQTLTQIVDSFEAALKQNLAAWQMQTKNSAEALETGWRLIDGMVIEVRKFGAAGLKAAAERDRRVNPSMLRWDWIAYYIDPITGNNTTLPPVPGGAVPGSGATGSGGGNVLVQPAVNGFSPVYIGAALILLFLVLRK